MKTFFTILKKELKRIFTDRRILFSLFMPGILIYFIYSIMGSVFNNVMGPKDTYTFNVTIVNEPEILEVGLKDNEFYSFNKIEYLSDEDSINKIENKSLDGFIKFDENFSIKLNEYMSLSKEDKLKVTAPKAEIYYNSSNENSSVFYNYYFTLLQEFETSISNVFDINPNYNIKYDLADESDIGKTVMQTVLPMVLMMFLATGAMSVSPDSIAGEKERGTIATLLITPTSRTSLAFGKISALSIAGIASALASTLGLILSLPKLMGGASGASISISFDISTYLELGLVIISTSLLFTVLFGLISTISKSVKEASSLSSIPMLIVTLLGMISSLGFKSDVNSLIFLIPFYNSALCINGILGDAFSFTNILITFLSNIGVTAILCVLMAKLFNSEKVMFKK